MYTSGVTQTIGSIHTQTTKTCQSYSEWNASSQLHPRPCVIFNMVLDGVAMMPQVVLVVGFSTWSWMELR